MKLLVSHVGIALPSKLRDGTSGMALSVKVCCVVFVTLMIKSYLSISPITFDGFKVGLSVSLSVRKNVCIMTCVKSTYCCLQRKNIS